MTTVQEIHVDTTENVYHCHTIIVVIVTLAIMDRTVRLMLTNVQDTDHAVMEGSVSTQLDHTSKLEYFLLFI